VVAGACSPLPGRFIGRYKALKEAVSCNSSSEQEHSIDNNQLSYIQIYRLSHSTPQVHRIIKTFPLNTTTRNMVFFPRFVAHEFAPALRGESNNIFSILDDYASLMANRSNVCALSLVKPTPTFRPRFDVKETKDSYELHGELPGIAQKDINIEFTDATTISIRGRTERVREEGRRPTAAVEPQPEQQKLADNTETESTSSSNNYHKASVEDEEFTTITSEGTTEDTPASSEAPSQPQEVAKSQEQADASNYWFSERSVGSFARSFSFGQRVDQENVKATLRDGVLSIVVPKAPVPANRTISIQ
jgi:HSP20 family protein